MSINNIEIGSGGEFNATDSLPFGKCRNSPPVTKPDPSQPAVPDCVNTSLYILTDQYPEEINITLTNELNNEEVWSYNGSEDLLPLTPHVAERCIDPIGCYNFTITDSFGDGLCYLDCYGEFQVIYNGTLVASGDSFGSVATTLFGGGCE